MSVKEEDRNKTCPSRGLGIAAAAIGVGVGAALYYFFSKRPENPADEGATTSGWNCEEPHPLQLNHDTSSSSYTTISEYSTSDTSMNSNSSDESNWLRSANLDIMQSISRQLWRDNITDHSDSDEETFGSGSEMDYSFTSASSHVSESIAQFIESTDETQDLMSSSNRDNIGSDSETNMEWDVTTSSLNIPREEPRSRSPIMMQFGELTVRLLNPQSRSWKSPWKVFPKYFRSAGEQMSVMREQAFRERTWSLEECSICFEIMLKDQEVLALACTHRFHQACIMPWLQERQTCPNCRKAS